jgi:hypothetical protein
MTAPIGWLFSVAEDVEQQAALHSSADGRSPSEMGVETVEFSREPAIWCGHQGCPEMDLANVIDV